LDNHFDFIGSWQLIPEKSIYTKGVAPKSMILKISVRNTEPLELFFDINWFTHDNQSLQTEYLVIANGLKQDFQFLEVATEVKIEVKDKSNFIYFGYKNDQEIWQNKYTINQGGYLEVSQTYIEDDIKINKFDIYHKQLSVLPYASSVSGVAIIPTQEGVIKIKALQAMTEQTDMHLNQIKEQIELLAKQAHEIQRRKELSYMVYNSKITFVPQIGQVYHLYERKDSTHLLSLVAPKEWGNSMPYKAFTASVKLLADHTWTEV
jgi:Protein of unknown function (DUF2452)